MRLVLVACLALGACARAISVGTDNTPMAKAQITNSSGEIIGTATFRQQSDGVAVDVAVKGLTPGTHGIHVHTVGTCDPAGATAFSSAGGHFNPTAAKHGLSNPAGPHAGDLPNLEVDAKGEGALHAVNNRVSIRTGANALLDADGSAIVIHAGKDDQVTDPAGNSGARVACGVIK